MSPDYIGDMAQPLIRAFLSELRRIEAMHDPIVEFGSLQVDASQDGDLRPLFGGREFVGTDMRAGPGVDQIEDLRALSFADGEVGTAICLDTLEHCEDPVTACRELYRVTRVGGICVISSVMLFGIHSHPNDYFRFTPEGFRSMLGPFDDVWVAGIGDPDIPMQVVGVGAKQRQLQVSLEALPSLAAAQREWEAAAGQIRIGPFRLAPRELVGIAARETTRNARRRARGIWDAGMGSGDEP
jgi:SAM-dependent methyltransferase